MIFLAVLGQQPPAAEQAEFGMLLKAEGGDVKNVDRHRDRPRRLAEPAAGAGGQAGASARCDVSYKLIEDVGRQMFVKIPSLPVGQGGPGGGHLRGPAADGPSAWREDPGRLHGPRCADRRAGKSPSTWPPVPRSKATIRQVHKAAQEAIRAARPTWGKVQAIHQWVHKNIAFTGDLENVQTCPKTLELRHGVCAELNSLTVAMLRALRFPARLVRIPGHCYYEVYLLDGEGRGHWLAGDAGPDATITLDDRPGGIILQKGDNVSVIDPGTHRRAKGRILAETATGTSQTPAARVKFQSISPAFQESPSPSGRGPG